jgi:hypothetical protein
LRKTILKASLVAGTLAAVAALSFPAASAVAAPVPHGKVPVATVTSKFLGGYIAASTDRFGDVRTTLGNLPDLSAYTAACIAAAPSATTGSASACAGTIAEGVTLAQSTNGEREYGIGAVWDAPSPSTCSPTQWTVEAGDAFVTGPVPVPLPGLSPLMVFGNDICVNPGSSQAVETYYSSDHDEILFQTGPTEGTELLALIDHNIHRSFFAAGAGVDVSSGENAGLLPSGTLAGFTGGTGLTLLTSGGKDAHQKRIPFNGQNIYDVTGTVSGFAPSPLNQITLLPGPFSTGSSFTVTVP